MVNFLSSLKKMEVNCFRHNTCIKEFNIPLDIISNHCFLYNEYIQELLKNKENKSLLLKRMLI